MQLPEVIEAGAGKIVGTDAKRIVREATHLLRETAAFGAMSGVKNPFGEGRAAERIDRILAWVLQSTCRP